MPAIQYRAKKDLSAFPLQTTVCKDWDFFQALEAQVHFCQFLNGSGSLSSFPPGCVREAFSSYSGRENNEATQGARLIHSCCGCAMPRCWHHLEVGLRHCAMEGALQLGCKDEHGAQTAVTLCDQAWVTVHGQDSNSENRKAKVRCSGK
ncbi:uncharacterized protein PRD47_010943 isoform 1-T3 [Ara ararauna]